MFLAHLRNGGPVQEVFPQDFDLLQAGEMSSLLSCRIGPFVAARLCNSNRHFFQFREKQHKEIVAVSPAGSCINLRRRIDSPAQTIYAGPLCMADNIFKHWASLYYSPKDNCEQRRDTSEAGRRCWGNWLYEALKTFSIPPEFVGQINGRGETIPERIEPVFRDESELPENTSLSAEMREVLEQSRCLVVICSPRSAQSRPVNEAVRYFKQLGRGKNVLPIVVAGEPNASTGNHPGVSPADECFVPALRHPVHPDGTLDTSRRAGKHIYVDARHGVGKREILANDDRHAESELEMAKIQLIALLIGVGFHGLWRREQKRHFFDLAEAQRQAGDALDKIEETRRQLHASQRQSHDNLDQALELKDLPRELQSQIQAAQHLALEARNQAPEAQQQLQEFQNNVREMQTQLDGARQRALAAESKVREAQQYAQEVQAQLEETRNQLHAARNAQSQSEEIRQQAQSAHNLALAAQSQILEFQNQARSTQIQLEEARDQVREAQGRVLLAQNQARAAQDQVREIQNRKDDAQRQIEAAQIQVQKIQNQNRNARRLTKVFALLAVLALMTTCMVATQAWRQRQAASLALARAEAETSGTFDLASFGSEPIPQVLQNIGGAKQVENRRRSLDALAAGLPRAEIPGALEAAAIIVDDQERSHFQKWLLVRLGWANPVSAMTNASAIAGKIVNEEGLDDSNLYFQLAVLDNWMQTDLSGAFHWVCQLPDANAHQRALDKIIHWVQSQPDSEVRNKALINCIDELSKTDIPGALAVAESLPEGAWRDPMIVRLWMKADPFGISDWINGLSLPPEIMSLHNVSWPFQKADFGRTAFFPAVTGMLSTNTNGPVQVPARE
jgi:hypothetical protein